MKIIKHIPSDRLLPYVKQIWIVEEESGIDVIVNSFPVGYPFINVISGYPFSISRKSSDPIIVKCYLTGQVIDPFQLEMKLVKRAITIQLQPYSIPVFFNMSAKDMIGQIIPLDLVAKDFADHMTELISGPLNSKSVLIKTDGILCEILNQNVDERLLLSVNQIVFNRGKSIIKNIAHDVNLSQRRLQQLYDHYLGISAKTFSRIARFQNHSFQALNGKSLDLIVPDGYYDQAHFIHEVKELTGMLPKEYFDYICLGPNRDAYFNSNLYYSQN